MSVVGNTNSSGLGLLKDSYGRPIRDLRVSLTDRCNFRCFYCLPHGEPPIAPKEQMLSYEEIEYVCEIFVALGIEKIRLTGGEPMLRKDIETIIRKLAKLKVPAMSDKLQFVAEVPGKPPSSENDNRSDKLPVVTDAREKPPSSENDKLKHIGHSALVDLALTTNGYFLPERAQGSRHNQSRQFKARRLQTNDRRRRFGQSACRHRRSQESWTRTDKDQCRDRAWSQRR